MIIFLVNFHSKSSIMRCLPCSGKHLICEYCINTIIFVIITVSVTVAFFVIANDM